MLTPAAEFDADLFATKVIAMLVAMLVVAVLLTTFVRRMPSVTSRVGAALLVLYLVPVVQDSVYVLAILAATALVLCRAKLSMVAGWRATSSCFAAASPRGDAPTLRSASRGKAAAKRRRGSR